MASPGKPEKKIEPKDIMKKLEEMNSLQCGEMRIQFTRNQGFIVKFLDDETGEPDHEVFTGEDVDKTFPQDKDAYGKAALMELFWFMTNYFGLSGSKYDAARIHVTTEPGEKFE